MRAAAVDPQELGGDAAGLQASPWALSSADALGGGGGSVEVFLPGALVHADAAPGITYLLLLIAIEKKRAFALYTPVQAFVGFYLWLAFHHCAVYTLLVE